MTPAVMDAIHDTPKSNDTPPPAREASKQASARAAAKESLNTNTCPKIDLLVTCAGAIYGTRWTTEDGTERA